MQNTSADFLCLCTAGDYHNFTSLQLTWLLLVFQHTLLTTKDRDLVCVNSNDTIKLWKELKVHYQGSNSALHTAGVILHQITELLID